jgi:hypothetical protein
MVKISQSAENKMVVTQEQIGDGLKTGAITPDKSQMFLTTLKGIRTDYTQLRDKRVYRDEWDRLNGRLDALGEEINRAYRNLRILVSGLCFYDQREGRRYRSYPHDG